MATAATAGGGGGDEEMPIMPQWRFNAETGWNGWTPNDMIADAVADASGIRFRTVGHDPQVLSPLFDLSPARNAQHVEIEFECDGPGVGELFYTNKTTGRYGGLEPHWMCRVVVPSPGRHTLRIHPFWEGLGRIRRLRFDPPADAGCRLISISIVAPAALDADPAWRFGDSESSWHAGHAASVATGDDGLRAAALAPQAMIQTCVRPFDAARRSLLRIDGECPGEACAGFAWARDDVPGFFSVPIPLGEDGRPLEESSDLRRHSEWRGMVTHLAIAFGTAGGETLTVRSLAIEENDPDTPFLRLRSFGFAAPVNRPGQPAVVEAVVEHAAGPPSPGSLARLSVGGEEAAGIAADLAALGPGESRTLTWQFVPPSAGDLPAILDLGGQKFARTLRVDPALTRTQAARGDGYDVPPPRRVGTEYRIGVYYFPGWSPDQIDRWQHQQGFPERDPVLGWYEEGRPEVADWHIKWAVENAIRFFVFDWYWRDGREALGAALNEGFLRARYAGEMEFALMWANHPPFSDHSPEQLTEVADTWIENYLRRPNYLLVDGKPYVSFFAPGELVAGLGSPERVSEVFERMRERARAAGLAGLHIGACVGPHPQEAALPAQCGFDSVTAYNYLATGAAVPQSAYRQYVLGHEPIWRRMHAAEILPYIPLLTVGWDSRPWHGPRAEARFHRRSEDFAEALRRLKVFLDATGSQMALLEAWNEWGEGSYIEPNAGFGFRDLEAVREVFAVPGDWPENIAPQDLGLGGAYDLRRDPAAAHERRPESGSP